MNGLKALDTIDKDLNYEFYDDNRYRLKTPIKVHDIFSEEVEVIRKELKALEIIKEKGLSTNELWFIKNDKSFEEYTETMGELYFGVEGIEKELKTKDEFDLLKEVLK